MNILTQLITITCVYIYIHDSTTLNPPLKNASDSQRLRYQDPPFHLGLKLERWRRIPFLVNSWWWSWHSIFVEDVEFSNRRNVISRWQHLEFRPWDTSSLLKMKTFKSYTPTFKASPKSHLENVESFPTSSPTFPGIPWFSAKTRGFFPHFSPAQVFFKALGQEEQGPFTQEMGLNGGWIRWGTMR